MVWERHLQRLLTAGEGEAAGGEDKMVEYETVYSDQSSESEAEERRDREERQHVQCD